VFDENGRQYTDFISGWCVGNLGTAPVADPFAAGIIQVAPLEPALAPFTDVYFRGYVLDYQGRSLTCVLTRTERLV